MSDFKITGPGFYRTRDGGKVEIVGRSLAEIRMFPWVGFSVHETLPDAMTWADDGRFDTCQTDHDLIAPWTEPKTGTVWVNVYEHLNGECSVVAYAEEPHDSSWPGAKLIARFSRDWTEGEGL